MDSIIKILNDEFTVKLLDIQDPFESLILTILSQNTNDKNRDNAWVRLKDRFEIKPEIIANADVLEIEEAIKVAGLQKIKSVRIKEVSQLVLDQYNGDMDLILKKPLKEARKLLVDIKGVGYKTADILLLFYSKYLTLPVDTHITRLSKRMGFASSKDQYENIRKSLEAALPKTLDDFINSHLLIIELGRSYCKAIRPKCEECPISPLCPKVIIKKPKKKKRKKKKK